MAGYSYSPTSDEIGTKKCVYLCSAEWCGVDCGYVKRKFCNDHLSAKNRAELKKENDEIFGKQMGDGQKIV